MSCVPAVNLFLISDLSISIANWDHTVAHFTDQKPYSYYNALSASSILKAEEDVLKLVEEEGPFDGVIGFCAGAALAAQVIIRYYRDVADPFDTSDRNFRFAIFFNGVSPLKVIEADLTNGDCQILSDGSLKRELEAEVDKEMLGPTNVRSREDEEAIRVMNEIRQLQFAHHANGQVGLYDGKYLITRFDGHSDNAIIECPTLHIRDGSTTDLEWSNHGQNLEAICEESVRRNYLHKSGHAFPRSPYDRKNIVLLVQSLISQSL